MDELLRTVEQHLKKQSEMKQYSEEKVAQFVETRLQEIQTQEGLDSQKTTKKQ